MTLPVSGSRRHLTVLAALLGAAALIWLGALQGSRADPAEPSAPQAEYAMLCYNVSPGELVPLGDDDNFLIVSEAIQGRSTGPDTIMQVGLLGCLTTFGCLPNQDIEGDGDFDGDDVEAFVNVLLGLDTTIQHVEAADFNCDGYADGDDIQFFVDAIFL